MKLKSNLQHVFRCCGINILPGVNVVKLDRFFKHPAVQNLIEQGSFEVDNKQLDTELAKSAKQLSSDVKNIFDIKLLEAIKKHDTRASVIKAVDSQINKIKSDESR
jgi:hypothetical protein